MHVEICQALEGALRARGVAVIIDVFRAFSTSCYLADAGAGRIFVVSSIDMALNLAERHPHALLIGENNGIKPQGFHYGNSPAELKAGCVSGYDVILATSAGTRCLVAAQSADIRLSGSFLNADAIVKYIQQLEPANVSLVCAGHRAEGEALEDTLCAEYIRDRLLGNPVDIEEIKDQLATCLSAQKFFDPEKKWAPEEDFDLCTNIDRFDFIQRLVLDNQGLRLEVLSIEMAA
jgi:2-phosphosulfolactate phosphatase